MLCDSNIIIYAADPADTVCAAFAEREDAAIAGVSRIEVLGFPGFGSYPRIANAGSARSSLRCWNWRWMRE